MEESRLVRLVSRVQTNAFAVANAAGAQLGSALYPEAASFINHSCAPTAFAGFVGRSLQLTSLQTLTRGEEVSQAYIELCAGRRERRASLQAAYAFACDCPRCETPPVADGALDGWCCPTSRVGCHGAGLGCGGAVPTTQAACVRCGEAHPLATAQRAFLERQWHADLDRAAQAMQPGVDAFAVSEEAAARLRPLVAAVLSESEGRLCERHALRMRARRLRAHLLGALPSSGERRCGPAELAAALEACVADQSAFRPTHHPRVQYYRRWLEEVVTLGGGSGARRPPRAPTDGDGDRACRGSTPARLARPPPDGPTAVVCCDWEAQALLRAEGGGAGCSSWAFLSALEGSGVPPKVAKFVRDATRSVLETRREAEMTLAQGNLGVFEEMADACETIAAQRGTMMSKFESGTPRDALRREAYRAAQAARAAARDYRGARLARRVASALREDFHAVVDDFLPAPEAAAQVGALLRGMHASGQLKAGQVAAGLNVAQRSDLMAWIPALAAQQPPALRTLLRHLDQLVLALARQPQLAEDLRDVPLMRGEAQCTVYPGGGSAYVRHTDDARQRVRKLTAILYANPDWSAQAGGELRLHLRRPADRAPCAKDVAPLHNRLVLFWSDARVPHEVLPSHALRYAVSVWYHDTRSLGERREDGPGVPCKLRQNPGSGASSGNAR